MLSLKCYFFECISVSFPTLPAACGMARVPMSGSGSCRMTLVLGVLGAQCLVSNIVSGWDMGAGLFAFSATDADMHPSS